MDTNKKWIDDIRRQAGDYKRKAPEGLLDDIKKEMSRRGVMPSQQVSPLQAKSTQKSKRMTIVWGRRVAVAAAVALTAVLVVNNLPKEDNNVIADNTTKANNISSSQSKGSSSVSGESSPTRQQESVGSIIRDIIYAVKDNGETFVAQLTNDIKQAASMNNTFVADNSQVATDDIELQQSVGSSEPQAMLKRQPAPSQHQNDRVRNWYGSGDHNYSASSSNRHSSFDIALNYGGMAGSTVGTGSPFDLASTVPTFDDNVNAYAGLTKATSETSTHAHHDMPIKVGVNVRYNINNRWSLQTGVNYSYLSSDITRENNIEEYSAKQKLHYVSVPVTASYSVWHNKSVNVYVSGGAEAAKLVKGKADVNHVVYGSKVNVTSTKEDVKEHRMQYSVTGTAGIEYKPTPSISVYAEPGVSHYFNNHSSVVNIYKDKPTQFSLNVGLRINLNKK